MAAGLRGLRKQLYVSPTSVAVPQPWEHLYKDTLKFLGGGEGPPRLPTPSFHDLSAFINQE